MENLNPSLAESYHYDCAAGDNVQNALGIAWDTKFDTIQVRVTVPDKHFTKRGLLATTNAVFDPLGFIAPIILIGKIIQRQFMLPKNNPSFDPEISQLS